MAAASIFSKIRFDNSFVEELPGDVEPLNARRQVKAACYSQVMPTPAPKPTLIAFSKEVAQDIGWSEEDCRSDEFLNFVAGNKKLRNIKPYAMCYGGHQFGNWAGQLGDGRAINLGEVITPQQTRLTLQLKGAGLTPYSRTADGLAVMRSSLREFLCSEAMFHLGVPTTRALSVVGTGLQVMRDMFYDGHPQMEPGAVVCRVAPSFIRFGNFQIHAARGEVDILKRLADYTIENFFPELLPASSGGKHHTDKLVYLKWLQEISHRTADMIVEWMRVGFVHGVMNTDNMSIHGLTIDYGPYGWLDDFDMDWTPNTTDAQGRRYRFGTQDQVAHWNLYQLANALFPLIEDKDALQDILDDYATYFLKQWQSMMVKKLGLMFFDKNSDDELIKNLLTILQLAETDMTLFYRLLSKVDAQRNVDQCSDSDLIQPLMSSYYRPEQLTDEKQKLIADWLRLYHRRLRADGDDNNSRRDKMHRVNPKYVLRNYMAQLAIDAAEQGDYSLVWELLELLRRPYDEQKQFQKYFSKRPDWARNRPGCSMLSCSS